MKRLCLIMAAALGALTLTPSAHALSCMPPDIQWDLKEAIESEKVYHILIGYFDGAKTFKSEFNTGGIFIMDGRTQTVSGSFSGYSLAKTRNADVPLERLPVQIEINCSASWCGQAPPSNQKMIAFVKAQEGAPPLLTMYACPYMTHRYDPEKERMLRKGL